MILFNSEEKIEEALLELKKYKVDSNETWKHVTVLLIINLLWTILISLWDITSELRIIRNKN